MFAPARNRILHRSARTLVTIPATVLRLQIIKLDLQETLRTAHDLCKNVSLAVLFGSNGNSYAICIETYVYVHIFLTVWRRWSDKRNIKWDGRECRVP